MECRSDVSAPLGTRQRALTRRSTGPYEQRLQTELPFRSQCTRKPLGRVMTAAKSPIGVTWNEGEDGGVGSRDGLYDELGRPVGEPPQSAFLPGGDDPPHALVVLDRRPGTGEREPAPGALGAATDRPCGRGAAAFTRGRAYAPERRAAGGTDLSAGNGADEAALRQQKIEHAAKLRADV